MITTLLTGAACGIIGMATGQALVLSMGRRGLAQRLQQQGAVQETVLKRVEQLEAGLGAVEDFTAGLDARGSKLEEAIPALITREEVQSAFAKAAQIEAQRQQAAMQQQAARQAAVFGAPAPPGDLNAAINNQLSALNERINRINQEFGIS